MAPELPPDFIKGVQSIAKKTGAVAKMESRQSIIIELSANYFPMWLRMVVEGDTAFVIGVVRTDGLDGDRSDYHELISIVWAAVLRFTGVASVYLADVPHPVVEGETWGRILYFEQPRVKLSVTNPNFRLLDAIVRASSCAARMFSGLYAACGGNPDTERWTKGERTKAWSLTVSSALRYKPGEALFAPSERENPTWTYYRNDASGLTAFRFAADLLSAIRKLEKAAERPITQHMDVNGALLIRTGAIQNVIERFSLRTCSRLCHAYNIPPVFSARSGLDSSNALLLPIDSHVLMITAQGVASLRAEAGYRGFNATRAIAIKRHTGEASFLFSGVLFQWHEPLNDEAFEDLILELVSREPGVEWARKVGSTRAADAGRDIVATWTSGPAPWQKVQSKDHPLERRNVVVQCKTSTGAINLSKVPDIPQILDLHNANGYLLVAYPRITPQVVDYLTRVPSQRGFWADWWTASEIEDRLRMHQDLLSRFSTVVSVLDP